MAKKKVKVIHTGVDEWMATYSDMVTLLLCFFVLLYASSTPDETKFQYIFQSFNSSGKYINPFVSEEINDGENKTEEEEGNSNTPPNIGQGTQSSTEDGIGLPHNFDDLFSWVSATAESSTFSNNIDVTQTSSSRINIRFNNSIMFEGDSAVLLDSGKEALKQFLPGLKATGDYIKNIRVQGHTAEGLSAVNDWDLSSARSCSVIKFMDYQRIVDSEKYVSEGRAQYDPIADNSTEEGRQENRRVELIIIRNDMKPNDTAIIQDILKYDYGMIQAETDAIDRTEGQGGLSDDAIQQIVDSLDDKYFNELPYEGETDSDYTGPQFFNPIIEIPEDILLPAETAEASETESE
ncbi:MAG: flagellar motor protein MotB [Ruminiclostridium sp.]|nr:flagellar motor protein MotB [Ruminiclostridium sp.]